MLHQQFWPNGYVISILAVCFAAYCWNRLRTIGDRIQSKCDTCQWNIYTITNNNNKIWSFHLPRWISSMLIYTMNAKMRIQFNKCMNSSNYTQQWNRKKRALAGSLCLVFDNNEIVYLSKQNTHTHTKYCRNLLFVMCSLLLYPSLLQQTES